MNNAQSLDDMEVQQTGFSRFVDGKSFSVRKDGTLIYVTECKTWADIVKHNTSVDLKMYQELYKSPIVESVVKTNKTKNQKTQKIIYDKMHREEYSMWYLPPVNKKKYLKNKKTMKQLKKQKKSKLKIKKNNKKIDLIDDPNFISKCDKCNILVNSRLCDSCENEETIRKKCQRNLLDILKSHKFTCDARSVLMKYYTKCGVHKCFETLGHDGYDAYGPESELWDFYIFLYAENFEKIVVNFHREDWYRGDYEKYTVYDDVRVTYDEWVEKGKTNYYYKELSDKHSW